MRTTSRRTFVVLLVLFLAGPNGAQAQLDLGAGIDVEYRMGGTDSRYIVNEIPSSSTEPHFALRQINLFALSDFGEGFFFEGRLQFDNIGARGLNPPRVGLAYLGWERPDKPVSVSVGRILNPFGLHPKHALAFQDDFVAAPLLYGYSTTVTQHLGFWPGARTNTSGYTVWEVGLSSLYRTGYVTGGQVSWSIVENTLVWDVAVTNSAPASRASVPGTGGVAGLSRLEWRPAVFWTQGFSVSHGTFMEERPENAELRETASLSDYRQMLLGTDFRTGYGFFELKGEALYGIWTVPAFADGAFIFDDGDPRTYRLTHTGGYLDAKVEPPFVTGSYLALRGERLYFPKQEEPVTGASFRWDNNVTRLSAVVGYKLHPRVLTKVSVTEQTPFDGSMYTLRVQLTSMF